MAPIPKQCPDALRLKSMRAEGRYDEALTLVRSLLKSGTASAPVQSIAAEMLAPKKPGEPRGPKKKAPFKWFEIGQEYDDLREDGVADTEARLILAERHPRGKRTIDTIVSFYNKAVADYRAEMAEQDLVGTRK